VALILATSVSIPPWYFPRARPGGPTCHKRALQEHQLLRLTERGKRVKGERGFILRYVTEITKKVVPDSW
jgi:hypothetical protein